MALSWIALAAPVGEADGSSPQGVRPEGIASARPGHVLSAPPRGQPALGGGISNADLAAASRGPELAATLAARLGLTYQDAGSYLLLSDNLCRVRVYPNSHVLSLDGEERKLRGYLARGPQGVTLPGPAAALVEAHVITARAARSQAALPAPPAPLPAPLPKAPAPPLLPPKLAPISPAADSQVRPDPSWVVAPTARAWKWVVLHHSDDTSGDLAKYHQGHLDKGWEHGCGYHFVIGNGSLSGDGEIEVSQRWIKQLQGAHAKTPDNLFNEHGVGICLVGDFERGSGRPTAAQMRSLTRLTQWLMDRYGIDTAGVRGHCHCKATCCPGKNFPWTELRSKLRAPAARGSLPRVAERPAALPALVPGVAPATRSLAFAQPTRNQATSNQATSNQATRNQATRNPATLAGPAATSGASPAPGRVGASPPAVAPRAAAPAAPEPPSLGAPPAGLPPAGFPPPAR